MTVKRGYQEIFVGEESITELDVMPPFYTDNGKDSVPVKYSDKVTWSDAPSVSISDVRNMLDSLESKGAERVYLYAHSDHHGYYMAGVKLAPVTGSECDSCHRFILPGDTCGQSVSPSCVLHDNASVDEYVKSVVANFPNIVATYNIGTETLLGLLVGEVMKASRGRMDPTTVVNSVKRVLLQQFNNNGKGEA